MLRTPAVHIGRALCSAFVAFGFCGLTVAAAACNALLGTTPPSVPDGGINVDVDASDVNVVVDVSDTPQPGPEASPCLLSCDGACLDVTPPTVPDGGPAAAACDAGDGGCAPSLLVGSPDADHGLFALYGIAVSGGALYGTVYYHVPYTAVYRAATTGYTPDPHGIFPSPHDGGSTGSAANVIATDGVRIYFAVFQDVTSDLPAGIYSIDPQGNGGQIATTSGVESIALDSSHVYWATPAGEMWSADKDGGGAVQTILPTRLVTSRIVVKGGRLYYSASEPGGLVAADPVDPSKVLASYSGTTQANGFDVGSIYVFWADLTNQAIYRAPSACPGAPENITPHGLTLSGDVQVLTDDQHVYVISSDTNVSRSVISRFRPDGSSLEVMATLDDAITGIDQDSTALYFGTYGLGGLVRPPYAAVWKLTK